MALARWQATIQDEAGNVLSGASVEVREDVPGTPLASIFSDRDGVTPLGNPFNADSDGFAGFYTVGGAYRITASLGATSRTFRYVPIGTAAEYDAADLPLDGAVTTAKLAAGAVTTAKVADDAITYAKLQNISATSRILGRRSASAGDAEENTISQILDFIGSAAHGDILYRGAIGWERLAAGTAGYVLQANGAAAPSWVAPAAAGSNAAGGLTLIETQAAANQASVDFTTGFGADIYDSFMLVIANAKAANDDVEAWLRVGTGVGPTWRTSGYRYVGFFARDDDNVQAVVRSTSDAKMHMTATTSSHAVGNATGESFNALICFNNPEATDFMDVDWKARWSTAAGIVGKNEGAGRYATAGAVTGLRFLFESGNVLSGRFSLYGLSK